MSKYLKMMAMKSGGKVAVQKASIGRLIGLGARKGVEMLTVSKSAIQKGAKDKVARDKFQESLKDFQRGKPEGLENMKVLDKSPRSAKSNAYEAIKNVATNYPKTAIAGAGAGAGLTTGLALETGRRMEKSKALEEKTFLNALRKIVKGE
jgi:hypothetical protein